MVVVVVYLAAKCSHPTKALKGVGEREGMGGGLLGGRGQSIEDWGEGKGEREGKGVAGQATTIAKMDWIDLQT